MLSLRILRSISLAVYRPLSCHALPNMFAIICTTLIAIQLSCVYIDKQIVHRLIRSAALLTLPFSFFSIYCAMLPCLPFRHTHTYKHTKCVVYTNLLITAKKSVKKKQTTIYSLCWNENRALSFNQLSLIAVERIRYVHDTHTNTLHTQCSINQHTHTHS